LKFPGWVTIGYYLLIDTTPAGKTTGFKGSNLDRIQGFKPRTIVTTGIHGH
jgi:hypothetical protein